MKPVDLLKKGDSSMRKPYRKGAAMALSASKKHPRNMAARKMAAAKMLKNMSKMSTVKSEPDQQVLENDTGGAQL
jgi:hypothetical protein